MPKTYEHTFGDLHAGPTAPSATVVDLDADGTPTDQTGARVAINPAPSNPDKGKADQFGDIDKRITQADLEPGEVDDGIDVDLATGDADDEHVEIGDGDDLKGLSKNVRERIERERRMRQEAEERQRRTEAELAAVSRKVDLQGKETEWTSADEKDDTALADLRAKKVKALEEGKTEEVVDLDDKILDLKAAKRTRNDERIKLREAAKQAPEKPPGPANQKAAAWIEAHPKYNSDQLFRKAANAADQALNAMGLNSQSDDYYVELSKILAKGRFAEDIDPRYLKKGGGRPGPRGMGSTGVRPGNSGQVRTNPNGRSSVVVTPSDKALLASMGQDPDDPAVIKSFAREKLAMARSEAAERDTR
jgi:hypothetical protein